MSKQTKHMDHYWQKAADALCREREHVGPGGMTGMSWRDGTCCCDYDVRAVLDAIGEVAGHVSCREELDRSERIRLSVAEECSRLHGGTA